MTSDMPERPDNTDDLAQAYARANALADDGRGPSAAVRANVLAAARAVAAQISAETAATLPLTPVAPPIADVGRGRPRAINLSSWRVRSGAALAAMALVALVGWHFDAARRFGDGEQVAMAELRLSAAPTTALPHELPQPQMSGASSPYLPPPVVEDPADGARRPAAKQATRDKDVIVAQLDQAAEHESRAAAPPVAPAPAAATATARLAQAPAAAAPIAADAAAAAPVTVASNTPEARPTQQEPTLVTIKAAPTQMATTPAMPPSVLQRRVPVVPQAAPPARAAAEGTTTLAETSPQRGDVEAPRQAYSGAGVSDSLKKKSAPGAVGALVTASARALPPTLHSAADRGDVETLTKLLGNPATPVDAPDSTGRTALLHAVVAQQPAAVRLLLAAGADPVRADQAGLTPRAAAQAGASAEIATLLAAPR